MIKKIALAAVVIVVLSAWGMGIEIVDTGHRGIKTEFGKVVSESLPEGLYFYNPLTSKIVEMDTRTRKQTSSTQAYTKDIQQAALMYTVNYRLDPTQAHKIYESVGYNWEQALIPQVLDGSIKNVIGNWNAADLISNRSKAAQDIHDGIASALKSRGIDVERFELTNIDYSDEFERAVEAKVTAIQRASEAENRTKQIEEEARQKVISAKAEAESMKIKSESLSQNKSLIEYEAVLKWDGKLPYYMGSGAVPFIAMGGSK